MKLSQYLQSNLLTIVENARFAPSAHNSQPWLVKLLDNKLVILLDEHNVPDSGDPINRQSVISLGIFTQAILVAAEALGLQETSVKFSGKEAIIQFSADIKPPQSSYKSLIAALKHRATDRSIYKKITISPETIAAIKQSWSGNNVKIWLTNDVKDIDKIADLTANGIGLAMSSPEFRKELSKYILEPWSKKKRGISVSSMYLPRLLAICQPLFVRFGLGLSKETGLERERWQSSSAIVLITSEGDMPEYWFEAGRAYLGVALLVEQEGLSQATSAATVEASTYHEDVEKMIGTKQRLQCVLRIGKGSDRRAFSPRADAESLITS